MQRLACYQLSKWPTGQPPVLPSIAAPSTACVHHLPTLLFRLPTILMCMPNSSRVSISCAHCCSLLLLVQVPCALCPPRGWCLPLMMAARLPAGNQFGAAFEGWRGDGCAWPGRPFAAIPGFAWGQLPAAEFHARTHAWGRAATSDAIDCCTCQLQLYIPLPGPR